MLKKLLIAVAVLALPGAANAADLPRKGPVYAPAPAPYNWTGFYVGINGGGGILNGDILDPSCFTCASTTIHTGFGTFGGQLGYNWQVNSFVFGIEGDLNWASADHTVGYAQDDGSSAGTATLKMDAFGSVRGRLGLAVDRTLIYVTGGPAWGHFNSSVVLGSRATPPIIIGTATDDAWRFGVAAGAGVEYAFNNNWIVRGEYLFLDFLDSQQPLPIAASEGGSCASAGNCTQTFANTASVVRVGLSYKFQ